MIHRKRYSVGAAIADFYATAIVVGAIAGLYVAIARRPVPLWAPLLGNVFTVAAIVVYHTVAAGKVRFRTIGEALMGRVLVEGQKQWTNPYGVDRTALFAVLFIALIGAGNLWDSVGDELLYTTLTIPVVLGRIAILGCFLIGLAGVGRASLIGALLVMVNFTFSAIAGLGAVAGLPEAASVVSPSAARVFGWMSLVFALVAGLVVWGYYRAAVRNAPKRVLVQGWDGPPSEDVVRNLVGSIVNVGVDAVIGPEPVNIGEFSRFARVLQVEVIQPPDKLEACPRCEAEARMRLTVEWEAGYESPDGNIVCEQCVWGHVTAGAESIPFGTEPNHVAYSVRTTHDLT